MCTALSQVKYSVLDRSPEKSGLLQTCKDLGVTLIAHSPLQRGLLTGEVACWSRDCPMMLYDLCFMHEGLGGQGGPWRRAATSSARTS